MTRAIGMRAFIIASVLLATLADGMAHEHFYATILSGTNEAIPNASPGAGSSALTLDLDLITLRVEAAFTSLAGTVTGATIYGPTAVAGTGSAGAMNPAFTASGFPTGVSAGSYDFTFDLTVASGYDPAFIVSSGGTVSNALNALVASFENGQTYLNIRTTAFPGGEVRGSFTETPEPASAGLLAMGCCIAIARRRR